MPERRPLSEPPPAAEIEGGWEDNPDSDGQTFSATFGVKLVVLRASLLLPLREPPLLVLELELALVRARLNPSSSSA